MNKNAGRAAALALALCLLFAACGGQGALPVSQEPPEGEAAQSARAKGPTPDFAPQDGEAERPKEDTAAQNMEAEWPQGSSAARSGETKRWQAVTIDAADFGIPDRPIGDPALYGGAASLPLGKLIACSLSSDGAAGEDLSDELWRRFLEDPDTVLAYLALMGDQLDDYWERPAAEVVCRSIASADGAWYNSIEFGEALAACRKVDLTGRRAELLDTLEQEHAASIERNGFQGVEPEHAPPREIPLEDRRIVSTDLADYGLVRTLEDPRFEYIFNHTEAVPLDQLIVFDLWGDALTEGSSEELRSRFLEAPDTVLAYLVLMGDQRVDYWDQPLAADKICMSIADADAAWHGGSEEFARTLAACRERYPTGRITELLDVLEREHAASMERNHGQSQ